VARSQPLMARRTTRKAAALHQQALRRRREEFAVASRTRARTRLTTTTSACPLARTRTSVRGFAQGADPGGEGPTDPRGSQRRPEAHPGAGAHDSSTRRGKRCASNRQCLVCTGVRAPSKGERGIRLALLGASDSPLVFAQTETLTSRPVFFLSREKKLLSADTSFPPHETRPRQGPPSRSTTGTMFAWHAIAGSPVMIGNKKTQHDSATNCKAWLPRARTHAASGAEIASAKRKGDHTEVLEGLKRFLESPPRKTAEAWPWGNSRVRPAPGRSSVEHESGLATVSFLYD